MPDNAVTDKPALLAGFFIRLESIETIIRVIIDGAEITALLTFRGDQEKKVLLDFSKYPCAITSDESIKHGNIYVTIQAEDMHKVLTGEKKPGLALGRREMLLRGNALHLSKFIPLIDFGPLLYRDHLADIGFSGYMRKGEQNTASEGVMSDKILKNGKIIIRRLSGPEKVIFGIFNRVAYIVGFVLGKLRYGSMRNLSLFEILESMSGGLEAATPAKYKGADKETG